MLLGTGIILISILSACNSTVSHQHIQARITDAASEEPLPHRYNTCFPTLGSTSPSALPSPTSSLAPTSSVVPSPSPAADPSSTVLAAANSFMSAFPTGDFASQWQELDPVAMEQWPSAAARTAMLQAKFPIGSIAGYSLGTPQPNAAWTSSETLTNVQGLWSVPVHLTFTHPAQLRPANAASLYASLVLDIRVTTTGAAIVGEGPASQDAPVLLPAALPASHPLHVPILMYHNIAPPPSPSWYPSFYAYRLDASLTVSPGQFAQEMEWFSANGFHAISLARLVDAVLYGLPLPSRPFVITFDDGRSGPWTYAVPILQRYGMTATFFITTSLIGIEVPGHAYLTWQDVSSLNTDGFWIEDHTLKDNVSFWYGNPSTVAAIITQSTAAITSHIASYPQFIAYTGMWPYPSPATAGPLTPRVFSLVSQDNYIGGVIDSSENSNVVTSANLLYLPRIRVNPNEALSTFAHSLGTAAGIPIPFTSIPHTGPLVASGSASHVLPTATPRTCTTGWN